MQTQLLPSPNMQKKDARMLSPLTLAFIGDTVFDLLVRTRLVQNDAQVKSLHKTAVSFVNASAQAAFARAITDLLSEEESAVYQRGRNAHAHHRAPKAASVADYACATGLEALFGYLFLIGDIERLNDLFSQIDAVRAQIL